MSTMWMTAAIRKVSRFAHDPARLVGEEVGRSIGMRGRRTGRVVLGVEQHDDGEVVVFGELADVERHLARGAIHRDPEFSGGAGHHGIDHR